MDKSDIFGIVLLAEGIVVAVGNIFNGKPQSDSSETWLPAKCTKIIQGKIKPNVTWNITAFFIKDILIFVKFYQWLEKNFS